MASRKPSNLPVQANLTLEQMQRGVKRLERLIEEIEAFDVNSLTRRWGTEQSALQTTIEGTLTSVFGHGTVEYKRYSPAANLDRGPIIIGGSGSGNDAWEARQYVTEGRKNAIATLKSAIKWLNEEMEDRSANSTETTSALSIETKFSKRIFIVHGHDEAARETVARFLERIGFEPIILHEQASQNKTVIEKIEANNDVGFAVVLLTPDDEGCVKGGTLEPRARQNVLLELGYFLGKLGRSKVCAIKKGIVEIPSDFAGVVWVPLDEGSSWKQALGKELQAAGYEIDWNKVMR